eukprot:gene3075-2252_t
MDIEIKFSGRTDTIRAYFDDDPYDLAEPPPTAKAVSISRSHSESPINVTSPPPAASSTSSNAISSASRARLNSNPAAESSIAYGRTRQNSTASAVGLLTRRNSEDLTPNRYSVRSPEYYLEPHADEDTSAFDRGSFRRHSEAIPHRDRMDSMSAEYSPIRRDDNTTGIDTADDEDEEAQLYERLQRGGGAGEWGSGGGNAKSLMAGLKPVSRSLEMGKKSMLPNAPAMNNPSKLNAQKQGIVGKSVSDRLHHTAELMRKKKEMLTKKAALDAQKKLDANKFHLNRHSQELAERNMGARYKDGHHLTDTLYQEGIKAVEEKKQKAQAVAKQRETMVRDWSCVKCGTFHVIPSTTTTGVVSGGGAGGSGGGGAGGKWVVPRELKCSKCGWNHQHSDAAPSFTPVNVGLTLHEDPQWLKNRQLLVAEEGQGSVHQYLYQTGMQREKILHFNRELWEEIDAQLPFAPTLPESSQRIVQKYKRGVPGHGGNGNGGIGGGGDGQGSTTSSITAESYGGGSERDDATMGGLSLSTHYRFNARLTGPALHDYLNRPTVERLVSTHTRSMAEEALVRHQQGAQTTGPTSTTAAATVEEREKRLNDLVYEYEAKEKRCKEAERHQLARDPVTGQRLFHPKVPDIPDELRSGRLVSVGGGGGGGGGGGSTAKGHPIWEKLVEKNKESEAKKLLMQRKAVEKTLAELQAHQVRALPTSNEILQESTSRNIAVLFRLLLAHTRGGDLTLPSSSSSTSPSPELVPPATDREASSPEPDPLQQPQQQQSQQMQRARKATSTAAARSNPTAAAAAAAAGGANPSPSPVIDVDRIHRISQNIQQWEAMTLDLAMVQPALMVNEVSTLLMDMKKLRWNEVHRAAATATGTVGATGGGAGDADTVADGADASSPSSSASLVVTFPQFKALALKCIRFRNGPGRGYVFAPKKKPEVALQLKEAQEQEETFRPTIDARSQELTKPRQEAYRRIPIEDMLHADGQKVQQRIDAERTEKERREQAAWSFQPTLYQPPPYVVSTLQASTQAPVFASGNGNVHFPPKPLPPAATTTAAAAGAASSGPTATSTATATRRPAHRSLQTPAEVRYHRFTQQQQQLQTAAQPSRSSPPARSPSLPAAAADDDEEEAEEEEVEEARGAAAGEADSHASWGVAPEDVVSSSSRSDTRYARRPPPLPSTVTQRRGGSGGGGGGGYGVDDSEGPPHRRLHVEELRGGGAGAGHHRRGGVDRSTQPQQRQQQAPPPPPPLPEGLSTGHPLPRGTGALQLTRAHEARGGRQPQPQLQPRPASGRKSTVAVAAHHPQAAAAAAAATGPSTGGAAGGGGYLQRMMSSKSNRSQSSNHSLTISRSNNK